MISRTNKELTKDDIALIADTYHAWRCDDAELKARIERGDGKVDKYQDQTGFSKSATIADLKANDFVLTPGRYVGTAEEEDDGVPFAEKMSTLTSKLSEQLTESAALEAEIKKNLAGLGYEL